METSPAGKLHHSDVGRRVDRVVISKPGWSQWTKPLTIVQCVTLVWRHPGPVYSCRSPAGRSPWGPCSSGGWRCHRLHHYSSTLFSPLTLFPAGLPQAPSLQGWRRAPGWKHAPLYYTLDTKLYYTVQYCTIHWTIIYEPPFGLLTVSVRRERLQCATST